jgi:hypothetical protein
MIISLFLVAAAVVAAIHNKQSGVDRNSVNATFILKGDDYGKIILYCTGYKENV